MNERQNASPVLRLDANTPSLTVYDDPLVLERQYTCLVPIRPTGAILRPPKAPSNALHAVAPP